MIQGTDRPPFAAELSIAPLLGPLPSAYTPRRGAILIVEDRDDVRQGLAQLLELKGYVVFEAANANEAFAHLDSSPNGIALILLDLLLPGTGGAEIRATQLADPRLSGIPIVVVSSCAADMDGGADLHAAAWLEKPFRFDQLLEQVQRFVVAEDATTSEFSIHDAGFRNSMQEQPPDA